MDFNHNILQKILSSKKNRQLENLLGSRYALMQRQKTLASLMGIKNPFFKKIESPNQNTALIDGKSYINYSSYDYLGLSNHPKVAKRVMEAIQTYGTSCSASRLAGGEKNLHRELEQAIAKLLKVEDSLVFVGGYTTNVSCIEHLFSPKDLILHDILVHNSILKGCVLSGAKRLSFPHNDFAALERILEETSGKYEKVLIVIEGVYSMDGDIPDLLALIDLKKKYGAYLMIDEAHSMGVIGKTGRGISEFFNISPEEVDIWMGTLSKAFASCGGYIAGSGELIEYLRYTAPGFVYSVGISPTNAAAALGAIEVFVQEPERAVAVQKRSDLFRKLCNEKGFLIGTSRDSAVIPFITGSSEKAGSLSQELFLHGVNAQPIFHPIVEESAARVRFFITALHTEEEITSTVELLSKCWEKIKSKHLISFALS